MTIATRKQPAAFDYSQLLVPDRIVVKQKTQEIRDRVTTAAQNVIEIGERLIEVKEHLPHGEFLPWLEAEFDWSESAALKMMQVGKQFKSVKFTDLTIAPSALYLLAAPSTPNNVRERFVKKAKAGKEVTHAEVKEAIAKEKPDSIDLDDIPLEHMEQTKSVKFTDLKTPPAKVELPKDKLGEPILDPELARIFDRAHHQIENLAARTSDVKCEIEKGLKANDELFGRIGPLGQTAAENLYSRLKAGMPFCVCRYCRGKDRGIGNCTRCQGTGWQTKDEYGMNEKAFKAGGNK